MVGEVILKCSGISKSFGPTRALVEVDLEVRRGEVCGLIGENGSGKSTLTSIIAGVQKPDSGCMQIYGNPYDPQSMLEGQLNKVGMIVQEMGTVPIITVADNIFLGNLESFAKSGLLSSKKLFSEARKALDAIGVTDIDPEMSTMQLNFEDRKIIEIARAMYLEPDILIIDESTTALAKKGRNIIYNLIKKMKDENKAVIFISHDLDELLDVCNTITVLRDGNKIGTISEEEMTISIMRKMMVGRNLTDHYFRSDYDGSYSEKVVLSAERISSSDGQIVNLNLEIHEGEILGIGGLANSGMHELGRMLIGMNKPITGKVVHKKSGNILKNPSVAVQSNVGYMSKDRDLESIILNASILDNIALPSLKKLSNKLMISNKQEKGIVVEQIEALRIKCIDANQFCTALSGGNKQKVALGKWLAYECDLIIMDCPTRGIDIGVKAAIYDMMYAMKKQGKAILMITEELVELIGMSDRMLIMNNGAIVNEFSRSEMLTESMIIDYMI